MIYSDRVVLILETTEKDLLDQRVVKKQSDPVPCMMSLLNTNEQMGMFGNYRTDRFKLHVQGFKTGFSEIEFRGRRRKISGLKHYRNSTVIYV